MGVLADGWQLARTAYSRDNDVAETSQYVICTPFATTKLSGIQKLAGCLLREEGWYGGSPRFRSRFIREKDMAQCPQIRIQQRNRMPRALRTLVRFASAGFPKLIYSQWTPRARCCVAFQLRPSLFVVNPVFRSIDPRHPVRAWWPKSAAMVLVNRLSAR
jgi:hypothetical protein